MIHEQFVPNLFGQLRHKSIILRNISFESRNLGASLHNAAITRTDFSATIEYPKKSKKSWTFVIVLAKKGRSPFNLTIFFDNKKCVIISSYDSFPCQMSQGVKGLSEVIHNSEEGKWPIVTCLTLNGNVFGSWRKRNVCSLFFYGSKSKRPPKNGMPVSPSLLIVIGSTLKLNVHLY